MPIVELSLQELWTLLNFIQPEKFQSLDEFIREFGTLSTAVQVERLHSLLRPHLLRRFADIHLEPKNNPIYEEYRFL